MMNGKAYMFYDIIFEYEEWKMECQSVDNNSNLISSQSGNVIQTFLEYVKRDESKIDYILNKLGLKEFKFVNRQFKVQNKEKEKDSCLSDSYNENTFTKTKSK